MSTLLKAFKTEAKAWKREPLLTQFAAPVLVVAAAGHVAAILWRVGTGLAGYGVDSQRLAYSVATICFVVSWLSWVHWRRRAQVAERMLARYMAGRPIAETHRTWRPDPVVSAVVGGHAPNTQASNAAEVRS